MKSYSTIFLLIVSFYSFGQRSNWDNLFKSSFEVFYGQKFFHAGALNGSVGSLDQIQLGIPISYIGLSLTGTLVVNGRSSYEGGYSYPSTIGFYHIVPQQIRLSDSLSGKTSGFNFRLPVAGFDVFRQSKKVDFVLGAGFNTGRIRLFGDSRLEQINAYFAPFVSISPRFILGRISLQLRAEYELDITRSRWRKVWFSNSPKEDLGPMKSTGLSASVSVGWVLSNRGDSSKDNK